MCLRISVVNADSAEWRLETNTAIYMTATERRATVVISANKVLTGFCRTAVMGRL